MRKTFEEFKAQALERPGVKKTYDELESDFELKSKLIAMRKAENITQEELAKRMNTTKSCISRLESMNSTISPTINTLRAYANALGKNLKISFA